MTARIDSNHTQPGNRFRVYAVADHNALNSVIASKHFAGCAIVEASGLIAVVEPQPQETYATQVTAVQLNAFSERMVELHRVADILPFRFASAIPLQEISALMLAHHDTYKANLQRISGCTEINARWVIDDERSLEDWTDPSQSANRSGADYLRAKHRASMREREFEKELEELAALIGLNNDIHCADTHTSLRSMKDIARTLERTDSDSKPVPTRPILIAGLEVLLRREQASHYLQSLSQTRFRNALPTVVSGPWPPLSFINDFNAAITSAPIHAPAIAKQVQKCAIFSSAEAAS